MNAQLVTVEYAHCIKWTNGERDVHPYSAYELHRACCKATCQAGVMLCVARLDEYEDAKDGIALECANVALENSRNASVEKDGAL